MGNPNQDFFIDVPVSADSSGTVGNNGATPTTNTNGDSKQEAGDDGVLYKDMIFPQRLMKILSEGENVDAIAWMPDGQSFIVADRNLFTETVMTKFFPRKSKFSSFVRKLNRWGFVRIPNGPNAGAYYNEFFRRDKPHLAARMFYQHKRTKASSRPSIGGSFTSIMDASFGSSLGSSLGSTRNSFTSARNSFGSGLSLSALLSVNSLSSFGSPNPASAPGRSHNAMWDFQPGQAFDGPGPMRPGSGESYGQTSMKPMEIHQRLLAACGVDPSLAANEVAAAMPSTSFRRTSQPNLMNMTQHGSQPRMEASIFNTMAQSHSQGLLTPNNVNFDGPRQGLLGSASQNEMFPSGFSFQGSVEDNQEQKLRQMMLMMQHMKNRQQSRSSFSTH